MHNLKRRQKVKNKMKTIKTITLIFIILIIVSCKKNTNDLDRYFEEARRAPAKQIEPLPEINPPEIFVYEAEDLRDPFSNDLQVSVEEELMNDKTVNGEGPDLNRRKETLERFPLDGLYMVGIYNQDEKFWGLVADPEGFIHRVIRGQHLGQNYGEIVAVYEDQIDVLEWVPDGLGGWIKREASIALREE
jgi:type IV pilus assembly protein PilP